MYSKYIKYAFSMYTLYMYSIHNTVEPLTVDTFLIWILAFVIFLPLNLGHLYNHDS